MTPADRGSAAERMAAAAETAAGAAVHHETVEANGIHFHVARSGDGPGVPGDDRAAGGAPTRPLILMLHGFPECWYSWRHQLRAFASSYDCAAPDLRGYGDTAKPEGGYDLDTLADDAAALVRALGHARATVVGHDWGGLIAWHVAARHPEVLERLAIINCPPAEVMLRHLLTNPRQIQRSWYIFFSQIPGLPEARLSRDGAAIIPRIFKSGATRREAFTPEDLEVFRQAMAKPGAVASALAYYRRILRDAFAPAALLRRFLGPDPPPIEVPGLVIWGRDDPFLGIELTHGLERRFRGPFTLRYIPRCGHWTQQEAPDEVNGALRELLATPLPAAAGREST